MKTKTQKWPNNNGVWDIEPVLFYCRQLHLNNIWWTFRVCLAYHVFTMYLFDADRKLPSLDIEALFTVSEIYSMRVKFIVFIV